MSPTINAKLHADCRFYCVTFLVAGHLAGTLARLTRTSQIELCDRTGSVLCVDLLSQDFRPGLVFPQSASVSGELCLRKLNSLSSKSICTSEWSNRHINEVYFIYAVVIKKIQ